MLKISPTCKHELLADYQREVEHVIPLGVVLPGKESYQAQGVALVQNLTRDLDRNPHYALIIAYSQLDRLARRISHDSHDRVVFTCEFCQGLM